MKIVVITETDPTIYNLGAQKIASKFRAEGHDVTYVYRAGMEIEGSEKAFVSAIFTWDLPRLIYDVNLLKSKHIPVEVGGPAPSAMPQLIWDNCHLKPYIGIDPRFEFTKGEFKMSFTQRGCPRACDFCLVRLVEGTKMTEYDDFIIPVDPGGHPMIGDNNILATSWRHQNIFVERLKGVKGLDINSGFDDRIFSMDLQKYFDLYSRLDLNREGWRFAYDKPEQQEPLKKCIDFLHAQGVDYRHITIFCVPKGTLISTNRGSIPIEQMGLKDKVLAGDGEFRNVNHLFSREYSGEMFKLIPETINLPIRTTADHKWHVIRNSVYIETKSQNLQCGDKLIVPLVPTKGIPHLPNLPRGTKGNGRIKSNIKMNKDLIRLLGYYLAEGSLVANNARVYFAFKESEKWIDDVEQIIKDFELTPKRTVLPGHAERCEVGSVELANIMLTWGGKLAISKYFAPEILQMPNEYLWELLIGYLRGDGSLIKTKKGHTPYIFVSAGTVSHALAIGLFQISAKLGLTARVCVQHPTRTHMIANRQVNCNPVYMIKWGFRKDIQLLADRVWGDKSIPDPKQISWVQRLEFAGNSVLIPIKKIESYTISETVYNLSVQSGPLDDAHAYVVNGIRVENCLVGGPGQTFEECREKLQWLVDNGTSPYPQRFRPFDTVFRDVTPPGWKKNQLQQLFDYYAPRGGAVIWKKCSWDEYLQHPDYNPTPKEQLPLL